MERVWLLGADDTEMSIAEAVLTECGERVEYALDSTGQRVTPRTAYAVCGRTTRHDGPITHTVECAGPYVDGDCRGVCQCGMPSPLVGGDLCPDCGAERREIRRIDHHRQGDFGFGRSPSEFFQASSIGQVIAELARFGNLPDSWASGDEPLDRHHVYYVASGSVSAAVPRRYSLCAAADHCLGAAYRGECPGIDPDELLDWRVASRASHQGRTWRDIMDDIERAEAALLAAPTLRLVPNEGYRGECYLGHPLCAVCRDCCCTCPQAADMRGRHVPELPEAGCRYGIAYVADGIPDPRDGRTKIVCSGPPEVVRAFIDVWAPSQGLQDCYGDPERGFAGGYVRPVQADTY